MSRERPFVSLVLVRHGQARAHDGSYGPATPLSELGRRQAAAVAACLASGPRPDAVYTSSFPRALETAQPYTEKLGMEPVIDDRLAEFEMGTSESISSDERADLLIWRSDHRGIEGGETLAEFSARVGCVFDEIAERHLGRRVVVFAHAGTIDAALRWSQGMPDESPWQHDFDLENASISELDFWPRGRAEGGSPRYAALQRIGSIEHLGARSKK